jgi:type I restriction enzyme S subunit
MAIEARQELVSPGYLYYWSLTLDLRTISNGGVIPQLNRKDLAPLVIPVPDLASQNELVEKFEMLETLCSQIGVEAKIRDFDCSHLRDAILRKAFAGEL